MVIARDITQFATNSADTPSPPGTLRLPSPAAAHGSLPDLRPITAAGLARVAALLATREQLWSSLAQRLLDGGCAAPTRIAALGGWEAWLHVWPPGGASAWHRHAGPTSSVVLRGAVRELRAGSAGAADTATGAPLREWSARHAVANDTLEPAVTLHVYGLSTPFAGRDEAGRCRPSRGQRSAHGVREAS